MEFTWRGVWDAATTYEPDDLVRVGNVAYIALRQTVGDPPATSPSDWSTYAPGGGEGPGGADGPSGQQGGTLATPTNLRTTGITTTNTNYTWDAVPNAQRYVTQFRLPDIPIAELNTFQDSVTTPLTLATISYGANTTNDFEVRVRAEADGFTNSEWSAAIRFNAMGAVAGTDLAVPGGLTATNVTDTTATLSWTAVPNAAYYRLRYRTSAAGGGTYTLIILTGTSQDITGLTASTGYEFNVSAEPSGTFNDSDASANSPFTTTAAPVAPDGTENNPYIITEFGSDIDVLSQLRLGTRGGPTYFVVEDPAAGAWTFTFDTTPDQDWDTYLRARDGTTTQSTDSELVDTTPHTQTVTADAQTDSLQFEAQFWAHPTNPTAATLRVTAPPVTLDVPGGLSSTGVDHESATVNWTAVANASGYTIGYRTTAGGGAWTDITVASGTATSQEITGLTASTGYDWRIRADGTGNFTNSAYTADQTFSTTAAPVMYEFDAYTDDTPNPGDTITANFTGTEPAGTTYQWQFRNTTGDAWADLAGQTARTITLHPRAVIGREYRIRWTYGGTTYDTTEYATVTAPPVTQLGTPTNPASANVTDTTATLGWTAVANADSYTVEYWIGTGARTTENVAATALTLTGLTPSSDYNWRVRAGGSATLADSPYTATQTFSTLAATRLDAPGGRTSSDVDHDSATLSWTAVANADGYRVQVRISGAATWTTRGVVTGTSDALTGLTASTDYEWRVRSEGSGAYRDSFYSTPSDTFTTGATPTGSQNWEIFTEKGAAGEGLTWRGAWDSQVAYAIRDLVHDGGSAWIATAINTNMRPSGNSAVWDIYAESGETGPMGPMGPPGEDGAGFTWRGAWSNTTAYAVNDLVRNDGSAWIATAANTGSEPPSGNWAAFAQAGADGNPGTDGAPGAGLNWRGAWSNTTAYAVRDLVHHNRSAWIASQAGTGNEPSGPSAFWDIYAEAGETGPTGPMGPMGPPGEDGDAGTVFVFRGEYDATTAYAINDLVQYQGSAYVRAGGRHG